jgi:hypothetical protein
MVMQWIKTVDGLPKDRDEVLIRLNGIVHLATYDATAGKFVCKNQVFEVTSQISWLSLSSEAGKDMKNTDAGHSK